MCLIPPPEELALGNSGLTPKFNLLHAAGKGVTNLFSKLHTVLEISH